MTRGRRLVYGPVPSRRFGASLGVDLVPYKTCCYDCIYCELGRTTELTTKRKDFYPPDRVLSDLRWALDRGPRPEVITLAGSGEPTLYRSLGPLLREIRRVTDIPLVLLTNGGLLFRDEVARDVLAVDVLAPSLDAGTPETFARINRPHPEILFDRMLAGLGEVARHFRGELRLEVVLVRGVNDGEAEWWAMTDALTRVKAGRVDLSTVVRPALSGEALACPRARLEAARRVLGRAGRVVSSRPLPAASGEAFRGSTAEQAERVWSMLAVRPSTPEELAAGLDLHPNEIVKLLALLARDGRIEERVCEGRSFFVVSAARRSTDPLGESEEKSSGGALDRREL